MGRVNICIDMGSCNFSILHGNICHICWLCDFQHTLYHIYVSNEEYQFQIISCVILQLLYAFVTMITVSILKYVEAFEPTTLKCHLYTQFQVNSLTICIFIIIHCNKLLKVQLLSVSHFKSYKEGTVLSYKNLTICRNLISLDMKIKKQWKIGIYR